VLGPLRGLVHAAGALDDGQLLEMEPGSLTTVLGPKTHAVQNLHRLTAADDLDWLWRREWERNPRGDNEPALPPAPGLQPNSRGRVAKGQRTSRGRPRAEQGLLRDAGGKSPFAGKDLTRVHASAAEGGLRVQVQQHPVVKRVLAVDPSQRLQGRPDPHNGQAR
jgi:hypothetical protein